jgi:hypothetical protein
MDEQRFTVIARSFEVEGVELAGRLVLEFQNGRQVLADKSIWRVDGAEIDDDLQFAGLVAMLSALPKKSAARVAA